MTNAIDTSPARLRELAGEITRKLAIFGFSMPSVSKALHALADEKEEPIAAFDTVAIEFAHRLAMHLECLLLDCQPVSRFFDEAAETLGAYRSAMNAIHEQFSPTHMGEPVLEREAAQCSSLCHPEEPCSISADGKCPACGSDCNERDELIKAEREIEKLRAEKEAAGAIDVPLPEATVPWPTVTRYSGGASHEGIGDRVWIRLKDEGSDVEYMPVDSVVKPAPVLLTDEECQRLQHGCFFNGWLSGPLYARAIEAAVLKKNGLIS